ncbi:MAG: bifunctional nicotinamidase/pyrazinamidase [Treponema sp.]|jgi:nicotinamidase/pyrazinamidase|nr:bifunctional nicotinamidase/pyrazinamidase [Treponema sp.]
MNIGYKTTALLAVDIQNDFCPAYTDKSGREYPAGALPVSRGQEVIDPLNSLAEIIHRRGGKVMATQDWHPSDHISFASFHIGKKAGDTIIVPPAIQQTLWPDHCIQNTEGAAFHSELNIKLIDMVFRKGCRQNIDSYSAFFENDRCTPTDLNGYLKEQGIDTLLVGGLALDYCVLYSVVDSLRLGYKTFVIKEACMGIDIPAGSINNAVDQMKELGAVFVSVSDF